MNRWLATSVAAVLLAGCAVAPLGGPPQGKAAPIQLGNTANETYRFEVSLAVIGQNVTVRRSGSATLRFDTAVSDFSARSLPDDRITAVELPETTRRYGTYTLAPGEDRSFTVEEIRQDEVLLVVVRNARTEAIHGVHGVSCRPGYFTDYDLTVLSPYDADWSSSCGG